MPLAPHPGSVHWLMRGCIVIALAAAASLLAAVEPPSVMVDCQPVHPTRILARLAPQARTSGPAVARALAARQFRVERAFPFVPGLLVLDAMPATSALSSTATVAPSAADALATRLAALRASGLFDYVEPDLLVTADRVPDDDAFVDGTLWGLHNTGQSGGVAGMDINAPAAWEITTGSTDVIVAVVDSGIRYTHTELAAQMWRNPGEIPGNGLDDDANGYVDDVFGLNAITGTGDPFDDTDHGTHVAGTIGASADSGGPLVGVAWQVRLMACKWLDPSGNGALSDSIECIQYAVAHGARIINASWGTRSPSTALEDAIRAARDRGVLFVASAGNADIVGIGYNNDLSAHYPSGYALDNIIAVAAHDRTGSKPLFSSYGRHSVDIAAPGVSILSCTALYDTGCFSASGTSMAAPHVSGVAALVLARHPGLSVGELRDRILGTTAPTPAFTGLCATGGRLDARAALTAASDGALEAALEPADGSRLVGGSIISVRLRVRDLYRVPGAGVSGSTSEGATLTFSDNGLAPDAEVGDGVFTASLVVPLGTPSLTLQCTATAPGKTSVALAATYAIDPPPGNDAFAARALLSGTSDLVNGSTLGATPEAGEPMHHPLLSPGATVWWSWTAPRDGRVRIETVGSAFDTVLAIYTGTALTELTLVERNDDLYASGRKGDSRAFFSATAGTTYQIAVDGYDGAAGTYVLALAQGTSPTIVTPPDPVSTIAGQPLQLSVEATGTPPLYYLWTRDDAAINGQSGPTLTLPCAQRFDAGAYRVRVTNDFNNPVTSAPVEVTVTPPASLGGRIVNLSTRAVCRGSGDTVIPGFVIRGTGTRPLLVRAIGPTLGAEPFRLRGALADPSIVLKHSSGGTYVDLAANDDWGTPNAAADAIASVGTQVGAFPLARSSLDAALLHDLPDGLYTVVNTGDAGTAGVTLVELYDAGEPPAPGSDAARLVNLSCRAYVGRGDFIAIPGFVVADGPIKVLIRAVGPTLGLPPYNVPGVLPNPALRLYRGSTDLLGNDDWSTPALIVETAAAAAATGAFPLPPGSRDAAIVAILEPGSTGYTVTVRDATAARGVALVELYLVP